MLAVDDLSSNRWFKQMIGVWKKSWEWNTETVVGWNLFPCIFQIIASIVSNEASRWSARKYTEGKV